LGVKNNLDFFAYMCFNRDALQPIKEKEIIMNKSLLTSKTFWVQVVTFAAAFVPAVQVWLSANPEQFLGALAAVNVLVRFATQGKVSIFTDK
jgi:hypothetical protein